MRRQVTGGRLPVHKIRAVRSRSPWTKEVAEVRVAVDQRQVAIRGDPLGESFSKIIRKPLKKPLVKELHALG